MKKISIVVPTYNEQENVVTAYNTLTSLMDTFRGKYDYEIIFTDNHSSDNTPALLERIAKEDTRVKVVRFSRNFGYQKSIYTGYLFSSGDAVIQFDCDLQEPPELIPQFIKKWEEGFSVVYGIRRSRKEPWAITLTRKLFYRFISFLSEDNLPHDAGDFRLVDKKIIQQLRRIYDYSPYLRGLIGAFGFTQTGIPYDRLKREKGITKFKFTDLVTLALDGIVNHSIVPLRLATYCGLAIFVFAGMLLLIYTIGKLFFFQNWPAGFTTITILILLSLGLNAFFLGIIGEYIGRIYQQVKKYPITVIEKTLNINEPDVL